jgi:hypothetical protein
MKTRLLLIAGSVIIFSGCSKNDVATNKPNDALLTSKVAIQWADMTLRTVILSQPNSPTYTSRCLGYIGLTMFESVVYGSSVHQSVSNQLNKMPALPAPDPSKPYNWVVALNAGQASIIKKFYPINTSAEIDSLETLILEQEIKKTNDQQIISRSVQFGKRIADAIFTWSETDGGKDGQKNIFDFNYQYVAGPGYWIAPPPGSQSAVPFPMHTYWGMNRNFIPSNATVPIPPIIPYSTDPASDYYKEFLEVYNINKNLTQEQKEIAVWWSDDPKQSYAPPGHSYNIASISLRKKNLDLFTAAEVYARTGLAVADAFIGCWRCKYVYNSQRPFPYIHTFIDTSYVQFWPEPPFPAFSSGHSTQAAAMATVLTAIFGDNFSLIDNTNQFREKDLTRNIEFKPRTYGSFWQCAEECGYSRLQGGIHTRQDNVQGLAMGKIIGQNVNALSWRK